MKILRYLRDRKILIIVLLISFTIFGLISITSIEGNSLNVEKNSVYTGNSSNIENNTHALTPATVKVLIYDGEGVIPGSVDGVEDCLNYYNNENLTSNVHFNYSTTQEVNSEVLSEYDVLIMPGGLASTYLEDPEIDAEDLKDFVYSGKGYVGICAGSYAASSHVDGYYDGWGIAPHIRSKSVDYVGELQISLTSSGKNVLNSSNVETLYHWNGPAMYRTDDTNDSMAEYADNETGYQNYAAIANDTYGSGRVILSGPHPELNPQKPEMLVRMILWASKKI
jgi:glutamine amidotransferase-like uncharacterized protein